MEGTRGERLTFVEEKVLESVTPHKDGWVRQKGRERFNPEFGGDLHPVVNVFIELQLLDHNVNL